MCVPTLSNLAKERFVNDFSPQPCPLRLPLRLTFGYVCTVGIHPEIFSFLENLFSRLSFKSYNYLGLKKIVFLRYEMIANKYDLALKYVHVR